MKAFLGVSALVLAGCAAAPLPQTPRVGDSDCSAACETRFEQCPRVFANFAELGKVECPAEEKSCKKACASHGGGTAAAAIPNARTPAAINAAPAIVSKETKLRELKRLHDGGLLSDDVYKAQQISILQSQ